MEEQKIQPLSGYIVSLVQLFLLALSLFFFSISGLETFALLLFVGVIVMFKGYYTALPKEAYLFLFVGNYKGTCQKQGFYWVNPLYKKIQVSLKLRSTKSAILSLNDKSGTPINISAIANWEIAYPATAYFEIENFQDFVAFQIENVLRNITISYPYESLHRNGSDISLLRHPQMINKALERELQKNLDRGGIVVTEAQISELAYAPEIAESMLYTQKIPVLLAAKSALADGAVKIAERTMRQLEDKGILDLDDQRRTILINSIIVSICNGGNTPTSHVETSNMVH